MTALGFELPPGILVANENYRQTYMVLTDDLPCCSGHASPAVIDYCCVEDDVTGHEWERYRDDWHFGGEHHIACKRCGREYTEHDEVWS